MVKMSMMGMIMNVLQQSKFFPDFKSLFGINIINIHFPKMDNGTKN